MNSRLAVSAALLVLATATAWAWWTQWPPAAADRSPPGAQLSGRVVLAPELASQVKPDDTVFIFARLLDGPRMPVAQLKRRAADLPLTFNLDAAAATNPTLRLSPSMQLVVSARVSRSGQAAPQAGDLWGASPPVPVGTAGLLIEIQRTIE